MKNFSKYIWVLFIFLFPLSTFSQIGINTENVGSNLVLHVDGSKDNPLTGAATNAQMLNDVVIDEYGNVGVGTNAPGTKLHIVTGGSTIAPNSQLTIQTGDEGVDKVLYSSADGTGIWAAYAPRMQFGTFSPSGANIAINTTNYQNTQSYISLPPGEWLVFYSLYINNYTGTLPAFDNRRIYILSSLSESLSSTSVSGDITGSWTIQGSSVFLGSQNQLRGCFKINNQTGSDKAYYLIVGKINAGLNIVLNNVGQAEKSSFYAFGIKDA
ncbi:hypothetical protein [Dysgonomonas sp. GY617]|uniref:hypothetical protein n=1 Tax=Dysgonomonas sp. GY617 TaxID=2780420 RepID=UPI0018839EFE|nr:hypothetical protein [Dysgonomonas sp. GY617]MBF0577126.1 hypothetical protein [Dysgonomonas sp. GY617]